MADVPVIPNAQAGLAYLASLELSQPAQACDDLRLLLETLCRTPPAAPELFAILEQARSTVAYLTTELGRYYRDRPLPLAPFEVQMFLRIVGLQDMMARGYALCAQLVDPNPDDPALPLVLATLVQRCIGYFSEVFYEHFRAHQSIPAGLWQEVNGYFASAESLGIARITVQDEAQTASCFTTYLTLLLVDIANPYALGARRVGQTILLARKWAGLCQIIPPGKAARQGYVLDLAADHGVARLPEDAAQRWQEHERLVDTSPLEQQLRHHYALLRQGESAASLGLPDETPHQLGRLLKRLLHPWRLKGLPRRYRRHMTSTTVQVAVGFENMYAAIAGQPFVDPETALVTRRDFDALFTFRDRVDSEVKAVPKPDIRVGTAWPVVDHSVSGYCLQCPVGGAERVAFGQLLALHLHDGEHFMLATVAWIQQSEQRVTLGVEMLPGKPEAVTLRTLEGPTLPSSPAFLLPPIPTIAQEASLIAQSGIYQGGRRREIFVGGRWQAIRLAHIQHHGFDFDRISYETL